MSKMTVAAFDLAILTLAILLAATLQAPTRSDELLWSSGERETEETPLISSCPGYHPGNPSLRNRTDCLTGSALDPINHEMAFGFHEGSNPDWSTCRGIPRIPQANERICYRTTVDQCGTDYRVHLNHRNEASLQRQCPSEDENLPTTDGSDRYLQSPRYGCRKGRGSGSLFHYRRSELCLYNISIPDCESGWLIVESSSSNDHQIEEQMRDDSGNLVCTDYLQIFYRSSRTERFCDNHLTLKLPLSIPATQFLAVFWTDPSTNDLGFKLRARCRPLII